MDILLRPHDPAWADAFESASALVLSALGSNAIAAHHIGSTAIPNILAKPIIDLMIAVADIELVDACNPAMERLGYEAKGEFGIPTRRYFRKDDAHGIRTHHTHVFPMGSDQIDRHLAFRDFMIAHPKWAKRYSDLKRELAEKHRLCMADYVAGKDPVIQQIDALAATWRRETQV